MEERRASAGFEIAFCITFFTGLLMWLLTRRYKRELIPRDGFLLVTMAWVLLALAATIPLYVNIEGISFVHAFFEATSGITTTCGTILSGLDRLPLSVNFWRCFLAWMGGIGILVMAVAVLPLLGVGGSQISGRKLGSDERRPAHASYCRYGEGFLQHLFGDLRCMRCLLSLCRNGLG